MTHGDVGSAGAVRAAKSGALAFAVTWHGLPVGREDKFYKTERPTRVKGGVRNLGDREKWEYSDVFFRVIRELQFLKSRPEWDGKTLISYGGSLGGILSAFASAIDKDVTLAIISVPSFCECNGYEAGRPPHSVYRKIPLDKLKSDPKLAEGMQLILKQLQGVLEKNNVEEIEALGKPFDPNYHNAVMTEAAEEGTEPNTVTKVLQKGYMLNKKVIRPSMVAVAQ